MNKRVRTKVAKRNAKSADGATERAVTPVAEALKDVETSAKLLARSVVANVQESAEDALEQLKEKLAQTQAAAEHLLEKVPGVGSSAARKLHDLTHS